MIGKDMVMKVARLARLNLTEKEAERFSRDLESILRAFKDLDNVDTASVKPSFHPLETKNVFRKDEPRPGLTQDEALANARNRESGYFKGPRVV